MRRVLLSILLLALTGPLAAQELKLPNKDGSVKFAVIGDTGTGGSDQYAVGKQLVDFRAKFPFEFVMMMGDNMYGGRARRRTTRRSSRSRTSRCSTRGEVLRGAGEPRQPEPAVVQARST